MHLHFLLLLLSILSGLHCTSSSKGLQITSLPHLTQCRIVHTHLNGQNRGHASLSYRYDSWKQSKHIFLAPSTSPHPPSEGTGEWWSASIYNRFSRLPRIKVVSARMTTSSSAGRAWSFTSLMNKKTVSYKCHSCLNCQMWTQLKPPGYRICMFYFYFFSVAPCLMCVLLLTGLHKGCSL